MKSKLYDLMDWARIEGLVYSEENHPHDFLGAHLTSEGVLIQSFLPTAKKVEVVVEGVKKTYEMVQEDEAGFFACLLPRKSIPTYQLRITYDDGSVIENRDAYSFAPQIPKSITEKFNAGICYDIYKYLGAHPMTIDGVEGTYFAVWAPNAVRVSVVGDFNLWDGRRLPMRRLWDSGIFELFVPTLQVGTIYKYEVKAKGGLTYLKADPYANAAELRPNTASIVADLSGFEWTDAEYLAKRAESHFENEPMSVYEVHLGSWKKPEDGRDFYTYRELAPMLADYVLDMGYTHIELLPIMEHPLDESWGYQITGYYAPTSRFGSPSDFMYFMNYMHEKGIRVILDWEPAFFPKDVHGLCGFDGTCLYEHKDPRQGENPHDDTLLYNYGRPEVKNFLIANALFWKDVYHADGIRVGSVAYMLYLDYDKRDGEWVANIYGGNENLDAIEFMKHLNSIFKKKEDGALIIAEECTEWPKVTGSLNDNGLGFDLKWNHGWNKDFLGYMQLDPIFRGYHHGDITFSMIYNYSERFMLALSHDDVAKGKGSFIAKMPGRKENKLANLRAAYGFTMMHPGKKLLFMGQDFGEVREWSSDDSLSWEKLDLPEHAYIQKYVRELQHLYKQYPALYAQDYDSNGFEWINSISANENMLVFLRKTDKPEETLLVVCNFSALAYTDRKIGVPFAGKYKEVFNSDKEEFGGNGHVNPRMKSSKRDECDARENSIRITVPPLGISVFRCTPVEAAISANSEAKANKTRSASKGKRAAKASSAKNAAPSTAKPEHTSGSEGKQSLKETLEKKVMEEGS